MILRTMGANLAIQVIAFATSVLIARILGPGGRGELALVLLYPQLVASIALLGVDRAIAVLSGRAGLSKPIATIIKLALVLSVPAIVAGYVAVTYRVADAHLARLATIYLTYVPPVYFFTLAVFLFNGIGDFPRFNRVRLGFYIVNLVLVITILAGTPTRPLDWVVFANLAAVYGGFMFAVWFLRGLKQSSDHSELAGKNDMRAVLRLAIAFALPVSLAHLSASAYQILLAHRMGVLPLGLFVVYFSYSRLLCPVGSAIGSHVFHLGITGESRDIAAIFRRSAVLFSLCMVPLWIVSDWLIPVVFGPQFVVDSSAVGLLLISCLFGLLADNLAEFLKGRRKLNADTGGFVIYLITLTVLGLGLVPSLGLVGMAVAMAWADLLRCGYLVVRVSRQTKQAFHEFWRLTERDLVEMLHTGKSLFPRLRGWR